MYEVCILILVGNPGAKPIRELDRTGIESTDPAIIDWKQALSLMRAGSIQ